MIAMMGFALLLQTAGDPVPRTGTAGPNVGDTIWITRTVRVAPRQTVRPAEWTPAEPIESVGDPAVTVRGTTVELRYPITIWRAGPQRVEIPGPLVLGPDGTVDSLPPYVTTLAVASVLPKVPADSTLAPQPRDPVVQRRVVSLVPMAILWALALLLLGGFRWWWRRRGTPAPPPPREHRVPDVPVQRWLDAGERRAVASLAAARLRAAAGAHGEALDPALATELRELLATLDRARFGAETGSDIATLFGRAEQLETRLAPGVSP